VLAHDGLYGRAHVCAFVRARGAWWRLLDWATTPSSEAEALGAPGACALVYARVLSAEEEEGIEQAEWPDATPVHQDNAAWLEQAGPQGVWIKVPPPEGVRAAEGGNQPRGRAAGALNAGPREGSRMDLS
jgi:hypothetical protein